MALTMFGIANCDTIKRAKSWLNAEGIAFDFHDYKKSGVDPDLLRTWVTELGWEILLNRAGTTFRALPDPGAFSAKDFVMKALYPIPLKHSAPKSNEQYERAFKMAQGKGISYDMEAAKERDRAKAGSPNVWPNVILGPVWLGLVIWSGGLIILGSALVYLLNRSVNKDNLKKSQEKNELAVAEHQRLTSAKAEAQQIVIVFEQRFGPIIVT